MLIEKKKSLGTVQSMQLLAMPLQLLSWVNDAKRPPMSPNDPAFRSYESVDNEVAPPPGYFGLGILGPAGPRNTDSDEARPKASPTRAKKRPEKREGETKKSKILT